MHKEHMEFIRISISVQFFVGFAIWFGLWTPETKHVIFNHMHIVKLLYFLTFLWVIKKISIKYFETVFKEFVAYLKERAVVYQKKKTKKYFSKQLKSEILLFLNVWNVKYRK